MNKLIPHIEYLLQSHDCVIIPGLGAVLAHGIPAFYDESRGVWVAPRRAVAFNPELSRTDGLLAASVARRDSLNIESATTVVRNEVDKMRKELELTGRLQLGSAGTLDLTAEGNLSFTPGDAACLSPSFAWLPSFAATPLESASELARRREATERKETWLPYLLRKGSRIPAPAAVLLALGWIVVQNLTYAPDEQFASVAPMTEAVSDRQATHQQMSPVVLVLARAPKDEVVENIPPAPVVKKEDTARYYLIVASLASMAEAEKYVRQHTDINLGILAKDGRYRVYAAFGNTSEEVLAASKTDEIASRYPSSWVCRR